MHCHSATQSDLIDLRGNIALVGNPNVGKSVIFQRLTGQQVAVANYPGTTVELARGTVRQLPGTRLLDTPGVITLPPHSDDEQVTARVLLYEPLKGILQVGDAKNLRRTLLLTVQLIELGLPMVLALNMMDEAEARGIKVNQPVLAEHLGIPVIATTATRGHGLTEITAALQSARPPAIWLSYPPEIEAAITSLSAAWSGGVLKETPVAARALVLMALGSDPVAETWLRERLSSKDYEELLDVKNNLQQSFSEPLPVAIQKIRLEVAERIASEVIWADGQGRPGLSARLGYLTTHRVWGIPILLGVLYALYWFVGVLGAGTLVGLLEGQLFGQLINPWVMNLVNQLVPYQIVVDLLVGEYGLWTMGITYAFALILPIVVTFFLAFGVMEDSGYLPRLAALSNRLFVFLGLNGKAILPMVLGLGCVTMATMTTRVLESKRERLLVTLLLALAVPCSAQLGVVMGMLAGVSLGATLIWGGVVLAVLLVVGWLSANLLPGARSPLLVELPPLRLPVFSNVVLKTLARVEWYLKEVVPLFLAGTALLFALDKSGLLQIIIQAGEPLISGWLGLPPEASAAFLVGFMRRDFGATGLFVMQAQGLLNSQQVVVAMVTITLFIPCIASVMMIARERNWRTALSMVVFIIPLAFLVGGLLYRGLAWIGWGI